MTIADKLLQINQVKQDIKTAIETKGIPMTNVAFTEYANKILEISGGGDEYFYYSKAYYTITNNATLFSNAWTNHNKRTTLFDGNISFEVTDDGMGIPLSIYSGVGMDELYDLLESGGVRENEYLKITVNNTVYDATSSDSVMNTGVALVYMGGEDGMYLVEDLAEGFPFLLIMDTTMLGMPYGKAMAFIGNENVNYLKIESGFNHYYENGIIIPDGVEIVPENSYGGSINVIGEYYRNNDLPLIIPNSVTTIGWGAFREWEANTQPLVIPDSVTNIGDEAFASWYSNNQPLVIPNTVTSIGNYAFHNWTSNNQPLIIPNSVTSIGDGAFWDWSLVPYVEIQAITPPTLVNASAFYSQNNAPIYVPDESVDAYKTATNWVNLAHRIFSINDK